jgi:hypothetical protein
MPDNSEPMKPPVISKKKSNKRLWQASMLVAVIIVASIGSFYFLNPGTLHVTSMSGTFIGTPQSPSDGYTLTFGHIAPAVKFSDCKVVLRINGTLQVAQTINVTGGNVFTANSIAWIDLSNDGMISYGDRLVVSNPVSSVTYEVVIIYSPAGNSICSQSWTVP